MPALYILQSTTTKKFYVGSALNLPTPIDDHQRGHSPYTYARGSWMPVYQEQYATLAEARRRERQIKSWKSHRSIQELIDRSVGWSFPARREGQEFESPRACHFSQRLVRTPPKNLGPQRCGNLFCAQGESGFLKPKGRLRHLLFTVVDPTRRKNTCHPGQHPARSILVPRLFPF